MKNIKIKLSVILICAILALSISESVASHVVKLKQDEKGWMMTVDGAPIYLKGVTWSSTPVGFKYDYDLFKNSEEHIKAAIERDMSLMTDMGVNVVRTGAIPRKWISYIYENYGVYTVVNDYIGRYGYTLDGEYIFPVDYSEEAYREMTLKKVKELVENYKDVKGLLFYAFGNENNYGLEWSSTEIENLPEGEKHRAKAKYLYEVFEEVFKVAKEVDPNRPVGLVNGEIQYMSLIKELCPSLDYIAINAYRGKRYGPIFSDIQAGLDKPMFFMEMGCDAWNAITQREDHNLQAEYYREQWHDVYQNAYGNGKVGNCIGGFLFQWADEWWKKGQNVDLMTQEIEGNWEHEAYADHNSIRPNMQEEWWGICSISFFEVNGVHQISPRIAYYLMREIWKKDPYSLGSESVEAHFEPLQVNLPANMELAKTENSNVKKGQKAYIPLLIYSDKLQGEAPWHSSGWMGNSQSLKMEPNFKENPKSGENCMQLYYAAEADWTGVVWQHPPNDWGDQMGGWDLTGANELSFWVRGKKGGEKIKFGFGLLKDATFNDTDSEEVEKTLTTEWTEVKISLADKNLERIKTGFFFTLAGQGEPMEFYIDDILYK